MKSKDPTSRASPSKPAAPAANKPVANGREGQEEGQDGDYIRLHISPLSPDLLKVIIPAAVLPRARDISYHALQTLPDKGFGFVDLPAADADRIRKKLHGAVLRGHKIRIEPARPDDMPKPSPDAVAAADAAEAAHAEKRARRERKDKKRKRDRGELVGVELEAGRKVKRGWTVSPEESRAKKVKTEKEKRDRKDKKDKKEKKRQKKEVRSEHTDGPECLFKTRLPPNKVANADAEDDKRRDGDKKHKSKKSKRHEMVVHEFENTTKFPTFLKSAGSAPDSNKPSEFVPGKGWVGEDGIVLEAAKITRPTAPRFPTKKKDNPPVEEDDDTSSSGESSSGDDKSDVEMSNKSPEPTSQGHIPKPKVSATPALPKDSAPSSPARPKSSSSARSLTIKIPPTTPAATTHTVNPLEALYKRAQPQDATSPGADAPEAEPFTFFGGDNADEDEDEDEGEEQDKSQTPGPAAPGSQVPMTPFTKQDFEQRHTRSAAPTPDTAHPGRVARFWPQLKGEEEEEEGEEEDDDTLDVAEDGDEAAGAEAGREHGEAGGVDGEEEPTNPNTDFQKWFWEHRGDLNRTWMRRRKAAQRERRYRQNKARADRAI